MRTWVMWESFRHVRRHPYALLPGAPLGIINSAREWVDEHRRKTPVDIRRGPPAAFWEVDTSQLRSLPPPNTVQEGPSSRAHRIVPTPRTALFFFKGARILGRQGVVISPDNRVFAEFTYVDEAGGIDGHSVFRRRRFPTIQRLQGWYATLCYPSSGAYFHWVVESLPRIRLLRPHLSALDGVFVPVGLEPAMRESLTLMGIREDQIIPLDMESHYQPEHLLVPEYCAGLAIPEWLPGFLRSAILKSGSTSSAGKRIYVSRSDAGKRRLTNEDQIWPLLAARGFELVRMRDMTFRAQVELFDASAIVVGPHGAGLVNTAFCRAHSQLLELLPSSSVKPHLFHSLVTASGGQYWYLQGTPSSDDRGIDDVHKDFSIDAGLLLRTLDRMGAT